MTRRVLFVDDDPRVLQGYRRSLAKLFAMDFAEAGDKALSLMDQENYAVVVSDMRMPGMNGVELLTKIKSLTPDTVRIMLTGNADQETAVEAVNEGEVFRFLNKPCSAENMARAVAGGIKQYELVVAERELLDKTLRGLIEVLADVLSVVNAEAFGRTGRIREIVSGLLKKLGEELSWQTEAATLLSQIGCVILPEDLLRKLNCGEALSDSEQTLYDAHPEAGSKLINRIPRLEEVARAVKYQHKSFDGTGFPQDGVMGEKIPFAARLLNVAEGLDRLESMGATPTDACEQLHQHRGIYDPKILVALEQYVPSRASAVQTIDVAQLTDGMVLAEDVIGANGVLVVPKGHRVSMAVRDRLRGFSRNGIIETSVKVTII